MQKQLLINFIYSIGVLHHTPDTKQAFMQLAPLLKKGGIMAVYLYSAYGKNRVYIGSEMLRKLTTRLPMKVNIIYCLHARD